MGFLRSLGIPGQGSTPQAGSIGQASPNQVDMMPQLGPQPMPQGQAGGIQMAPLPNIEGADPNLFAESIARIESGGRYDARGPVIERGMYRGDRAYGKYQIMGKNIPEWSRQVLGREVSIQEFMQNPAIQDQIFQGKFMEFVQRTGNPADAASMWFTGRPLAQARGRSDQLGTSAEQYVARFNRHLGEAQARGGPAAPRQGTQQPQRTPQQQIDARFPNLLSQIEKNNPGAAANVRNFLQERLRLSARGEW